MNYLYSGNQIGKATLSEIVSKEQKRFQSACHAMQGMIAGPHLQFSSAEKVIETAIRYADELLRQLEDEKETKEK